MQVLATTERRAERVGPEEVPAYRRLENGKQLFAAFRW
jgi:hypothetical protein